MSKEIPPKLTKAKSRLVLRQAFFATILLSLELTEDENLHPPTMAVNDKHIFFHPAFVEKCSVEQLVGVLAHECMHMAMLHPWRRGNRQHKKANVAMDFAINGIIEDAGLELPPERLRQASFDGKSFEEIYHLLPDMSPDDGSGNSQGQDSLDNVMAAEGTESEKQQSEAEAKVKIQQAANAAKAQGQLPASLAKLVAEVMEPKVDWKNELRRYMTLFTKSDQSWAKKQKRFQDIYLPAFHSIAMGRVGVGIDTSGSVYDEALTFLNEVRSICEECKPECVEVVQCESRITDITCYEPGEVIKAEIKGGGGTDLRHIFKHFDKEPPVVLIVLTDLMTPFPDYCPEYPVLWVSTEKHVPPFGETIYL
jgi:predicted metal-dependent peptidase